MSVLIDGMEMPTAGMCKTITIFDDGAVVEGNGSEKLGIAVPVPPHGDLIDRDALMHDTDSFIHKTMLFGGQYVYSEETIKNAPTIIGAEEGE